MEALPVHLHRHSLYRRILRGEGQPLPGSPDDGGDILRLLRGYLFRRAEGGDVFFQQGGIHVQGCRQVSPFEGLQASHIPEGQGRSRENIGNGGKAQAVNGKHDGFLHGDRGIEPSLRNRDHIEFEGGPY